MGIEKGRWVDGRYVDGNGNEITPPVSERPKGYNPSTGRVDEVEKKDISEPAVSVGEILEDMEKKKKHYSDFTTIKKVFTVPVLTMLGIWILVYYQVTSHYHKYSYGGGWETKKISQH